MLPVPVTSGKDGLPIKLMDLATGYADIENELSDVRDLICPWVQRWLPQGSRTTS